MAVFDTQGTLPPTQYAADPRIVSGDQKRLLSLLGYKADGSHNIFGKALSWLPGIGTEYNLLGAEVAQRVAAGEEDTILGLSETQQNQFNKERTKLGIGLGIFGAATGSPQLVRAGVGQAVGGSAALISAKRTNPMANPQITYYKDGGMIGTNPLPTNRPGKALPEISNAPSFLSAVADIASDKMKSGSLDYEVYDDDDDREDFYMIDKEDGTVFGMGRLGEMLLDQKATLLIETAVEQMVEYPELQTLPNFAQLGSFLFKERLTHPDFGKDDDDDMDMYREGGKIDGPGTKPLANTGLGKSPLTSIGPKVRDVPVPKIDVLPDEAVKNLQKYLKTWGWQGDVTGIFDEGTRQAFEDIKSLEDNTGDITSLGLSYTNVPGKDGRYKLNTYYDFVDPESPVQEFTPSPRGIGAPVERTQLPSPERLPGPVMGKSPLSVIGPRVREVPVPAVEQPTPPTSLNMDFLQYLPGAINTGLSAIAASGDLPTYAQMPAVTDFMAESYARRNMGLSATERAIAEQDIDSNFDNQVGAIKAITGGGGVAGQALAALGGAAAQANDASTRLAGIDNQLARENNRIYGNLLLGREQLDREQFSRDYNNALSAKSAATQALSANINDLGDRVFEATDPSMQYEDLLQKELLRRYNLGKNRVFQNPF